MNFINFCVTLFAISFISLTPVKGLEWADGDAIYIEDGAIYRQTSQIPEDEARVTTDTTINENTDEINHNSTIVEQPPTAIPVEIIPGQCVKVIECYPILFYTHDFEQGQGHQVVDDNLFKYIMSTANYCEPSDLPESAARSDIEPEDVYIWCPLKTFSPSSKPNRPDSDKTVTVNTDKCGPVKTKVDEDDPDLQYRVVGGTQASLGEFPWMVALTNKGRQFCSGTLIDNTHVLLAAHCVSHLRQRDLKGIRVLIGDHDIKDPTDIEHQERNVSAVIFHSNFTMRTVHSDIGMIVLSDPVEFADNIAPICLTNGDSPIDDGSIYGMLTGWGSTALKKPGSTTLMKTSLRIWRQDECIEKYKGLIALKKEMVCAGSTAPILKDACKGDSGGPLQLIRRDRVEQVGIVSFGIGCGAYPGVFSRVSAYLDWIEKHRSLSSKYFLKY